MARLLELYLKGGRFDDAEGFPLESLPALRSVGDLIRSVARDLFFAENPDRKRVPAGFETAFTPALTRLVGGGSALCDVRGWERVQPELSSYFEDAQQETMRLLNALKTDKVVFPAWCSRKTKRTLVDVLSALDENETMQFKVDGDEVGPPLLVVDSSTRAAAQREAERRPGITEEVFSIVGRLYRIDNDPWGVGIKVHESGKAVHVAIIEKLHDAAREEFYAKDGHLTLVRGIAEWDEEDGGKTYIEARDMSRVGGPPMSDRLAKLGALQNGWIDDDEESKPPSMALIRNVERQLWEAIEFMGGDRPSLFATTEGGIEAIWRTQTHTVRVLFKPGPLRVEGARMDINARKVLDSAEGTALSDLHEWLLRNLGGEA